MNVPAEDFTLTMLRSMVDGAASESELVECLRFRLIFVLEELCLNVQDHGVVPGREIEVKLDECPSSLVLRVRDNGIRFNPLQDAPDPDLTSPLTERKVGGLGVYLLRSLVDDLFYERDGDCNSLRLVLRPEEAKAGG